MIVAWLIVVAILSVLYQYLKHFSYWKTRGVPGPPAEYFFGNLREVSGCDNPRTYIIQKWTKKFGGYFGMYEGIHPLLIISDSDMVQEFYSKKQADFNTRKPLYPGKVDTDDMPTANLFSARFAKWKRLRLLSSPSFSNSSLKKVLPTIEDSILEVVKLLESEVGKNVNMVRYHNELAMDVISRIAMGQKKSNLFQNKWIHFIVAGYCEWRPVFTGVSFHLADPGQQSAVWAPLIRNWLRYKEKWAKIIVTFGHLSVVGDTGYGNLVSDTLLVSRFDLRIWFNYLVNGTPWLTDLVMEYNKFVGKLKGMKDPAGSIGKMVEEAVIERIREREDAKGPVESTDFIDLFLNTSVEDAVEMEEYKQEMGTDRVMTRAEVVAQCILFLFAGFDTTANSLSFATHLIAKHPEVMKKMQEEIDDVCKNESISYDDLGQLKYMECVLKESLRLYPLASNANSRIADRDTSLGGLHIEKGTYVAVDVLSLHHNKEIWGPEADEFKPERWLSSNIKPHHLRLALLEEKLTFAHILKRFNFKRTAVSEQELTLEGAMVVCPKSVTIELERRLREKKSD